MACPAEGLTSSQSPARLREWAARGDQHFGLIFTSDESLPRSRRTIGLYVERLDALLERHPADEVLRGSAVWL